MKNLSWNPTWPAAVRCPEDNDIGNGATFEAGYQDMTNGLAYLKGKVDVFNYPEPVAIQRVLPATILRPHANATAFTIVLSHFIGLMSDNGWFSADLGPYIPDGATFTSIEARVLPGAARTGTNRMRVQVERSAFTDGAADAAVVVGAYDNGSAVEQIVTVAPAWTVAKSTHSYFVNIRSGNTAGAAADAVINMRLNFTAPGVRP